jgi:hypothetical protein
VSPEAFDSLLKYGGMLVAALAAYYGANNAMRENLARLDEKTNALKDAVSNAQTRADDAHERIDQLWVEKASR